MTRRYRYAVLPAVVIAAAAPAAAASGGKTSHAKLFQNKAGTVACGEEIHLKSKPATNILCSAPNLPVPTSKVGDPFIQISSHGKPTVVYLSQASYVAHKATALKTGAKWSLLGVSCTVLAKTVKCENKSKHGFTIGKGKYKSF